MQRWLVGVEAYDRELVIDGRYGVLVYDDGPRAHREAAAAAERCAGETFLVMHAELQFDGSYSVTRGVEQADGLAGA